MKINRSAFNSKLNYGPVLLLPGTFLQPLYPGTTRPGCLPETKSIQDNDLLKMRRKSRHIIVTAHFLSSVFFFF